MMRHVLGSNASIGGVLGSGRGAAAAADWWLSGGVSAANAIAVYQPIGAASLVASYTNLANPGTYNAAPGVAPTFAAATGWTLNGTTQYLTTGVTPANNQQWSMLVRFSAGSNSGARFIAGLISANDFRFWLMSGGSRNYGNGESTGVATATTAGTMSVAGRQGYYNGAADGGLITTVTRTNGIDVYIGCRNANGTPAFYFSGSIQAVAIYDKILNAAENAEIATAMSALTG